MKAAIQGNIIQNRNRGPNRLERIGTELLRTIGVPFQEQVLIADKFLVDALVGENIVIQWDGDYWHGYREPDDRTPFDLRQKKRRSLDASQDAYMRKAGYTVLRFWEHQVYDASSDVILEIHRALGAVHQP